MLMAADLTIESFIRNVQFVFAHVDRRLVKFSVSIASEASAALPI
jgi:hypothetical protein